MTSKVLSTLFGSKAIVIPFGVLYPKAKQVATQSEWTMSLPANGWAKAMDGIFKSNYFEQAKKLHAQSCLLQFFANLKNEGTEIAISTGLPKSIVFSAIKFLPRPGDDSLLRELATEDRVYALDHRNGKETSLGAILTAMGMEPKTTAVICTTPDMVRHAVEHKVNAIGYTADRPDQAGPLLEAGAIAVFDNCSDLGLN